MIKRLLVLTTLGVMLSGCFMVPMAFVGPAVSGFSTASIAQSAVTTGCKLRSSGTATWRGPHGFYNLESVSETQSGKSSLVR